MFTIHVNPYLLRLNFSKLLVEDDDSSANYDPTSGYLTVTLTKETKGEVFEDLDLLGKLLAPRPRVHKPSPLIEVLHSESDDLVSKTQSLSLNHSEILEGMYASFF
jgi:protein SHQ1